MSTIEVLRNKRTHLKGTATRLENFLNLVNTETSLFELRARLERLEKVYENFQSLDIEMAALDADVPERDAELEDFETRYFRLKTRYCEIIDNRLHSANMVGDHLNSTTVQQDAMQKLIDSQSAFLEKLSALQLSNPNASSSAGLSQTANTSVHSADVRLPKLNIPVFEGNYSDFKSFYDLFTSSVHNNLTLTASQKFQYLKGLLRGEPAMLIRHLAVSDQNYAEAVKKLQERYDKPTLVIDSLIETFLSISKADNPQGLRNVSNVADEVVRGLRAQGNDAEKRDPWLIHLLLKKVDRETHQSWAENCSKNTFPTLESFLIFINERCDALERVPTAVDRYRGVGHATKTKSVRSYTGVMKKGCSICLEPHHVSYCPTFQKLTVPQRIELVKEKRLCYNCLKPGHLISNCPSKLQCQKSSCHLRHHTDLHLERNSNYHSEAAVNTKGTDGSNDKKPNELAKSTPPATTNTTTSCTSSVNLAAISEVRNFNMLLPIATVLVRDNMRCYQSCNILLDSGCQNTLVSEKCAQRLGLPRQPSKIFVSGLGNNKAGTTKGLVDLEVSSCYGSECVVMQAHVFKNLTTKLGGTLNINYWDEVKNLTLADPKFDTPKEIDILVGFDYFFSLLRDGRVVKDGVLLAQNSMFGYILCGGCMTENTISACHLTTQTSEEEDLNKTLKLFWEMENIPPMPQSLPTEDQKAEDFYKCTTIRADRYSVRLPFIEKPEIGESYIGALRRMLSMERKFQANPDLKSSYSEFMSEYLSSGHMKLVSKEELSRPKGKLFYLPHHAVLKESSLTTKLRVVFDGSYKSSNGKSLNDNLLKGPILQQDLVAVILRYRSKKYCFSADIKQMFRMIRVQECDQDYQRILWRDSPNDDIQHYRLTTVTYGTRPAPYLSIRTLLQLSEDEKETYPKGSDAIKDSFYVDDCMAGSNTIEEAQNLADELNNLLTAGGFCLRKWATNDNRVLANISESDKLESIVNIPSDITVCLLGVIWNPSTDCFSYKVKESNYCLESKRNLLSEISKIFDPLGWISPAIIAVKIIIQRLWLLNLEWDERIPLDILHDVKFLFSEFHFLNKINIPRLIFSTERLVTYHGFCDASSSAYAAVIYSRKISADGQVSTNIVISKTKVAPIASVSIPRLELCAAYLLTQLFEYLSSVINFTMQDLVCWSDSKTVLAWLASHPSRWKTFISHRTSYIFETLPNVKWRYVPSKQNPADAASRGLRSSVLVDDKIWFNGPSWLIKPETDWPTSDKKVFDTREELRPVSQVALTSFQNKEHVIDFYNQRISQWFKFVRVISYCIRFIRILKSKLRDTSPLKVEEINIAEIEIYKHFQALDFADTIALLKKDRAIITNKKLRKLSPFLDTNGVLRVGGRLSNADLSYDSQHQIILHKNSPIVRKIVHDCHLKNLHAGITLLVATLRQKYWIIGAREIVKTVTHQCGVCLRYNARPQEQLMGSLPKFRVKATFPFYEVGCDYAGPFLYKQHSGRKSPIVKAYVAVFICLITKAVHLELVSDLSSDAFLAALDRFVARRGLCGHIHSDNGTNFHGAARKLNDVYKMVTNFESNKKISNFLSSKGIQWHFIPPGAPHFGGAWESTVKSMKFHLCRTMGQDTLNYEQLSTLLARIEAILNSRPLVQADSDDVPYISPGHFLVGRPLNAVPEVELSHQKTSSLSKWRLIQQLTQSFWSRWSTEYLLSLQPKSKWLKETPNICVGDIVLLRDEKLPPACWKLGRVMETHAGKDGLVVQPRSVKAIDDVANVSPCELEQIINQLVYPSPQYQMHVASLRNQLRNILRERQLAEGEEQNLNPDFDYLEEDKRSVAALAAQGLLHHNAAAAAKRSLATLAKNGQLPTPDPEISDEEGQHTEDKRYVGSLARSGNLMGYGKRNIGTLARDYQLPNGKRNLATMARLGLLGQRNEPKRNVASVARYNSQKMLDNAAAAAAAAAAEKRNIGALKSSPVHGAQHKRAEEDVYLPAVFDYVDPLAYYWNYGTYADMDWGDFGRAQKRFLDTSKDPELFGIENANNFLFSQEQENEDQQQHQRQQRQQQQQQHQQQQQQASSSELNDQENEQQQNDAVKEQQQQQQPTEELFLQHPPYPQNMFVENRPTMADLEDFDSEDDNAWLTPNKRHIGAVYRSGFLPSYRALRSTYANTPTNSGGGRFSRSGRARDFGIVEYYPRQERLRQPTAAVCKRCFVPNYYRPIIGATGMRGRWPKYVQTQDYHHSINTNNYPSMSSVSRHPGQLAAAAAAAAATVRSAAGRIRTSPPVHRWGTPPRITAMNRRSYRRHDNINNLNNNNNFMNTMNNPQEQQQQQMSMNYRYY